MNPIANLPATQNLKQLQQQQGCNRQYFGGDEVDQFTLSQEAEEAAAEEQKKSKLLKAIGIGAAVILGVLGFGWAARSKGWMSWAKLGNNENSLTGMTKLSKGTGDNAKQGATLAESAMTWTFGGGCWSGVGACINGSADKYKDGKIVFVGSEENAKKLEETLSKDLKGKVVRIACETWAKLKSNTTDYNRLMGYLGSEKNLVIVDTALRKADGESVIEQLKKALNDNDSASGDTKKTEGKKTEESPSSDTAQGTDSGTNNVDDSNKKAADAKKKEDMKAINEAINNKKALVLNSELVKKGDDSSITFTIGDNQRKKYTMKSTQDYTPSDTDTADLTAAGSAKLVFSDDHSYYLENSNGTISVNELTEVPEKPVETPPNSIAEGSGEKLCSYVANFNTANKKLQEKNLGANAPTPLTIEYQSNQITQHKDMAPSMRQFNKALEDLIAKANEVQKTLDEKQSKLEELNNKKNSDFTQNDQTESAQLEKEIADCQSELDKIKSLVATDNDKNRPIISSTTNEKITYKFNDDSNAYKKPASYVNYETYVANIKIDDSTTYGDLRIDYKTLTAKKAALEQIEADEQQELDALTQEAQEKQKAFLEAQKKAEEANAKKCDPSVLAQQNTVANSTLRQIEARQAVTDKVVEAKTAVAEAKTAVEAAKKDSSKGNLASDAKVKVATNFIHFINAIVAAKKAVAEAKKLEIGEETVTKALDRIKLEDIKLDGKAVTDEIKLDDQAVTIDEASGVVKVGGEELKLDNANVTIDSESGAVKVGNTEVDLGSIESTMNNFVSLTIKVFNKSQHNAELEKAKSEVQKAKKAEEEAKKAEEEAKKAEEKAQKAKEEAKTLAEKAGKIYDEKEEELSKMKNTDVSQISDNTNPVKKLNQTQKALQSVKEQIKIKNQKKSAS